MGRVLVRRVDADAGRDERALAHQREDGLLEPRRVDRHEEARAHAKAARDPALLANGTVFIDVIDDWIDQLLAPGGEMKRRVVHRIPDGVRWIMCQNHACVIAKCKEDDVAHCSGRFGR